MENDAKQGNEYHKDRHERNEVADGNIASVHGPFTGVSFRLLNAGVENAAVDGVSPVIRHDG